MSTEEVSQQVKKNTRCFFDITIANKSEGKIVFELFDSVCPRTVENFRSLCVGDKGLGQSTQKPLHFKGCPFHRIIKNFMVQGGDFSNHNGTGGESIYGEKFEDENFEMKHDKPGLLSMANAGPNTNGSQFFITCKATPHLDGKHVVFGKVIKGMGLVRKMENLETENDKPKKQCVIENCGVIPEGEEISNEVVDDGTGDIYSDSPEESGVDFTKFDEVADIAEKIKVIGNEQFKLGKFEIALEKYSKALSYIDHENSDSEMSSSSEDDEEMKNKENKKDKAENIKNEEEETKLKRYKSIFVPCHLNSAACYLKLKDYNNALESCNEVIADDEKNTKALFRRGQAHTGLQDYDTALVDLNAAHVLAPTDKGILNEITRVKKLVKNYKDSEKKKYSKLFS